MSQEILYNKIPLILTRDVSVRQQDPIITKVKKVKKEEEKLDIVEELPILGEIVDEFPKENKKIKNAK